MSEAIKRAVWGEPVSLDDGTRDFYRAKFENGSVRPNWSHSTFTRVRMQRAAECNR